MKLPRRKFLHLAAGAAALPSISRMASAQAYPTRSVRLLVGYPAGGGVDIVARLIGQVVVRGAWSTIRHREPAGRKHEHRY
jgi:tripartite-type tricarboxylate transporter receptor subunit TctC